MAVQVTLLLDEDIAAALQDSARQSGRSFGEVLNESLRTVMPPRRTGVEPKPFKVKAKALYARPGIRLDKIEKLLEFGEGPDHR